MRVKLFDGVQRDLILYNGQPLVNFQISFTIDEDCDGDQEDFEFDSFVTGNFRVYNERSGRKLKDISISQTGSSIIINTTDTIFEDNGNYYYEIVYVQSGGYEIMLMHGTLKVI